jgi:glycosyltransferase involved in cell wall biosynthesis
MPALFAQQQPSTACSLGERSSAILAADTPDDAARTGAKLRKNRFRLRSGRLRVLHVNKLYTPWIGGIEAVVQELAEGLVQLPDVHCEVLVCQDHGRKDVSEINGVRVTRVASSGMMLSMPVALGFSSQLQAMASDFDIVHVHTPFPLVLFCDWNSLKAKGVRVVIHHHSDIIRPLQRALLSPLKALEDRFLNAADKIVVTSEGMLKHSLTLADYRSKCRVIPLSIDLSRVRKISTEEKARIRHHLDLQGSDRVVIFVGRLAYYKGVQYLIEAARDLDIKLLIAGDGPLRTELVKQIERRGLSGKVRILGRVTSDELAALYSIADLFVLPSIAPSEAFGLVQLEAMSYGLPVINTDLPSGVPSVSLHGETGLTVRPGDSSALRDAIALILRDNQLRARFSKAAGQRVYSFSRPVILDSIHSLYRELISDPVLSL